MTRDEFLTGLSALGSVDVRPQPNGTVLAVLEAQPAPGSGRRTRVAFMLGDPVTTRPQQFVDGDMRTRSGGVPNNWQTTVIGTDVFGTWSFNCPWDPNSDTAATLALAALAQWNR